MKTIKYLSLRLLAVVAVIAFLPVRTEAQVVNRAYFNIDWNFNIPISNDFASTASGWGMNFEGGYYFHPNMAVGAFLSYFTNNEYIGRGTLPLTASSAVTTDQQHSIFQLPFGASFRYNLHPWGIAEPYLSAKLGANYAKMSSYYYVLESYDKSWGFYASPEIGLNIFVTPEKKFGFHVALYYSIGTNSSDVLVYSISSLNNFGFRLGVTF